jgi:hypothetical protein
MMLIVEVTWRNTTTYFIIPKIEKYEIKAIQFSIVDHTIFTLIAFIYETWSFSTPIMNV